MTIFGVPLQYQFAGTSRSQRRTGFIPLRTSVGRRSPISPQPDCRVQKQRPIRNHQRLSTLSDLAKNIPRQSRRPTKSP